MHCLLLGLRMSRQTSFQCGTVPSGYTPLELTEAQTRAIGLATAMVETRSLERRLTTVGVVTLDETRTAHVHAKVRGVVEAVSVDFIGKPVRRGQTLCAIYSQPVLAAQMELIALLKQRQQSAATHKELGIDGELGLDAVVDGARRRLLLWDVPKAQIERIEKELMPSRTFPLTAPRAGTVIERRAYEGAFVEPGTELYVLSDTSKLWAQIDIYEADLAQIRVGTPVTLRLEGSSESIETTLDFLPPVLDEGTRTLKARASLDNPRGQPRPGAFLTAELTLGLGSGLVVPESAVLRTGKRDIVFVVHGPHVLPREVKLGPLVNGVYRIDAGLSEGEQVATTAQFLLDSDSRLRATSKPGGAHAGH